MIKSIFILVFSILISSSAHVLLKKGVIEVGSSLGEMSLLAKVVSVSTSYWIVLGVFCHFFALLVWLWGLSRVDVSFAYPFLSLGYIFVTIMACFWLGEQVSVGRIMGMAVLLLGVFIISVVE